MRSGEARHARGGSEQRDIVQGSLEGILPDVPATAEANVEREPTDAPRTPVKKRRSHPPSSAEAEDADDIRASLDALEENITLLLARHASLAAAHADDEERRRSQGALDPVALDERARALEEDRERLERHSAFLEDRIRGLLSRVRYVIES